MDSLYYPSNEDRVARRVFIVVAALLLLSVPGTDNEGRFLEAAPDNGSLGAPILIGEASAHRSNSHLSNTHRYQLHQMKVLAPVDCPIREKLRVIREYTRGPVGARFHEDVRVAIRPVMRLWLDSGPLAQLRRVLADGIKHMDRRATSFTTD